LDLYCLQQSQLSIHSVNHLFSHSFTHRIEEEIFFFFDLSDAALAGTATVFFRSFVVFLCDLFLPEGVKEGKVWIGKTGRHPEIQPLEGNAASDDVDAKPHGGDQYQVFLELHGSDNANHREHNPAGQHGGNDHFLVFEVLVDLYHLVVVHDNVIVHRVGGEYAKVDGVDETTGSKVCERRYNQKYGEDNVANVANDAGSHQIAAKQTAEIRISFVLIVVNWVAIGNIQFVCQGGRHFEDGRIDSHENASRSFRLCRLEGSVDVRDWYCDWG
jgi:hypothetical protein